MVMAQQFILWRLFQMRDTIAAGDMPAWLSVSSSERPRVVLALRGLVDRDALPHVVHALADLDPEVRAAAARELGSLGDGSVIPFPHRHPAG